MKSYFSVIFTIIILIISSFNLSAQKDKYTSKSAKAIKHYEKAEDYLIKKQYDLAEKEFAKALKEDSAFVEIYLTLADLNKDLKKYEQSINMYRKAIEIDESFFPSCLMNLAGLEYSSGLYSEAKEHFAKYLFYIKDDKKRIEQINAKIVSCNFAINAIKHPVQFNPINMGDSINSGFSEYLPSLTADEQTLVITVRRPRDEYTITQSSEEEDFYISYRKDSVWSKVKKIPPPLNTHGNEGAQAISPDGSYIIFTACNRFDGFGSCDLYYSRLIGSNWSKPVNLGEPVNSASWESQPSISSDGKTIYFISSRPGGKGGTDIWYTTIEDEGKFSVPMNIGDSINTVGNEMSPFIHPDNNTLYFSSNGHPGMGDMDIFYSRRKTDGKWGNPINIGYPINTYAEELYLIVNAKGNLAYFSSNKLGGFGKEDLYYFELSKEARPIAVTYLKGIVYDSKNNKLLEANFELIDLESGNVVVTSKSNPISGEFLICLPTNKNYGLNVSKEGYLFYSDNFEIKGEHLLDKPYEKNVPLQPILLGEKVILKNIFFDTDKSELKIESQSEIDRLITLLSKNPLLKIEISGHTDNVGTKEYNQNLSLLRAKAVFDYLIKKGININRLTYIGYGITQPIETNDTPEGRTKNRRTEFKVIEK